MLQALLSFCEGNTLSIHLLGDAVALGAAVAQGPWLCDNVCNLVLQANCDGVLIIQVLLQLDYILAAPPITCLVAHAGKA